MTKSTVKCSNCNVVINELLAFIQNKAAIMDEDSMIRLCTTAFTEDEIILSKQLLFESVDTSRRKVKRRNEGKVRRDIEDIIALIKEVDPELVPIFVARDLHKLPPVTFDHLDATRLLRDIIKLQEDVAIIKSNYVTTEEFSEIKTLNNSSGKYRSINVNRRKGACLLDNNFEYESGPVGLITHAIPERSTTEASDRCKGGVSEGINDTIVYSNSYVSSAAARTQAEKGDAGGGRRSVERVEAPTMVSAKSESACATKTATPLARKEERDGVKRPTSATNGDTSVRVETHISSTPDRRKYKPLSDVLREGGEWKNESPSEGWIKIQRRRLKNRFVGLKGKADISPQCSFKAADVNVPFYIYNVNKETTVEDIVRYIKTKTSVEVVLRKIDMKRNKGYAAYKFLIPKQKLNVFMDVNLWPVGVSFRRFVYYKNSTTERRQGDVQPRNGTFNKSV